MAIKRPDELSGVESISADDILIAEINPDSPTDRRVVKIKSSDLISGNSSDLTTVSNIGSGFDLVSGIADYDVKVKTISGGSNISLRESNNTVYIDFDGETPEPGPSPTPGGGGGAGGSFAFFSNAENNVGLLVKTYYNTPTSNIYLSGATVDTAEDMKLYLRWDGPGDSYMGSGSINGINIPTGNITELGTSTRRFEGYLDNLDLSSLTEVTGIANGSTGILYLEELGGGPEAISVTIPPVASGTAKVGTELGLSSLKGGDSINVYAVFNTNDVSSIKVFDSGISNGIAHTNYPLVDTGDGNYTAEIPISITSLRSSDQRVAISAINSFGSEGSSVISVNSIHLDQTYPVISATDPTNFNGRSDGLRPGEFVNFTNSISDWNVANSDTVSYTALTSDISVANPSTFEGSKRVDYVQGIYNDSDNITIRAVRVSNGAVDNEGVKIKIAYPPEISGITFAASASSAVSPHVVGTTEVKGGDVIDAYVVVSGNGTDASDIRLSLGNFGLSDGKSASAYASSNLGGGVYRFTVPVTVTSNASRDGDPVGIKATPSHATFPIAGAEFTSLNGVALNNSVRPSVTIGSITYPPGQQALKNTESATVSNTVTNQDTIQYTSPGSQLNITSSTTYETNKSVARSAGNYNISSNNFKITATKTSNGAVDTASTIVQIAHTDLQLTISNLGSPLSSSPAGVSDNFNMTSTQKFLEVPDLFTSLSQTSPSELTTGSQGTNTNSNAYTIKVKDVDTKGTFSWRVTAKNLAGKIQNSISTNPNYVLAGFSARIVDSNPSTALGRGLFPIGTTVSNPNNVTFENMAEGGTAPNGGTIYTYQSYPNSTQLTDLLDLNNKFTVCNSAGVTSTNGDFIFNLDKLIRDANSSTTTPAKGAIEES